MCEGGEDGGSGENEAYERSCVIIVLAPRQPASRPSQKGLPKKGCTRSCSPTIWQKQKLSSKNIRCKSCVRGPTLQERWQKVVCATQLSKQVPNVCGRSASGENACPAMWLVSEFFLEGGERHTHDKCIATLVGERNRLSQVSCERRFF